MKKMVLRTKLAKPLNQQLQKEGSKSALAAKIGVSTQKLTAMMSDDWKYITRDSLERAADYLKLGVADIFELLEVDFWKPIVDAKDWHLFEGPQSPLTHRKEFQKTRYNDETSQTVKKFMREALRQVNEPVEEHDQDEEEVMKKARTHNCIVVGSQKTNKVTEILVSRFFDAEPNEPSPENRRKIPFGFCWADDSAIVRKSTLTCSDAAREEMKQRPGIVTSEGIHVLANYQPDDKFREWETEEGLDCGLVFVANKPFGTDNDIKLIVLAGFTGVGTLAAARALVRDYRYLEPIGEETYVYGVVQAKYRKSAHDQEKQLKRFSWRYRSGGPSPIKPQ